jgi:lysophospholipase L1-like esterase
MRTLHVVMTVVLVLTLGAAITAAWMARHFYFRAKLASTEPVALGLYSGENETLQQSDGGRARVKPRIVLIGDSRIRAMRLGSLDKTWEVVNRGVNGETSAQLLIRIEQDALALKPEVIVIQCGINDLVAGIGSDTMAPVLTTQAIANLKTMAARSAATGAKTVILTVIPPAKPDLARRFVWSENIRAEVASVNQQLLDWNPPDGVWVLDLSEVFGSSTSLPTEFALNTLHLNQTGYAKLEAKLAPLISSFAK